MMMNIWKKRLQSNHKKDMNDNDSKKFFGYKFNEEFAIQSQKRYDDQKR